MAIKKGFFILLVLGISTCVTSSVCPSSEDIPGCKCKSDDSMLTLSCRGSNAGKAIQDYRKIFQDNGFDYKTKINFLSFDLFTGENRLPSRVFEGFDIEDLGFYSNSNISKWADEEGGPAFVGLEDSLKRLYFVDAIHQEPREYGDYPQVKAPMSLGHLSKLRVVKFHRNDIDTFANGWFDKGQTSIEILQLTDCKTRYIGDRAFASLTDLKQILLQHNGIHLLSRSMFPNPANHLEEMLLQYNRLEDLPDDMFTNMPSLARVELHSNHILRIREPVWRPVWSRLSALYLSIARTNDGLICDDEIDWVFNVKPPKTLFAICEEPKHMKGVNLDAFIKEKQKQD